MLRIGPLIERRRAVTTRDRSQALLYIATAAAANYRREKHERGLLDFDDLIDKTLAMLDGGAAGWVHYKLDRGVDHVLIDEAQDTSPRQWDIVTHLISEFTSGAGARDGVVRTVFAVGDEKQSIFSFQGAAPREFDARRRMLKKKFENAGLKFDPLSFTYSFRSGPAILHSVDHVFRDEAIYKSIHSAENGYPVHHSLEDAGPGVIDLWELQLPDGKQDLEGWRAPFDAVSETSSEVKLAKRIQAEIKSLIAARTMTGSRNARRPLRYGDMLVLVRRRGNAFDAVIQALKHADIPVAGADRLKLTEHIAIIDLMNLADALLLPQDDLALAVALKSPLFGLDDDDLFTLAWSRKGSLRRALASMPRDRKNSAKRCAVSKPASAASRIETPFAFYAWLLGGDGGRARILKRLGHEATDALDEFLELALAYERKAPASLQGFMAWLRAADTEVKRDMEISRNEVRVMTVHGAKGLEAPVVFLVDTTTSPSDTQRLRLIHLPQGNAAPNAHGVVVWAGRKAEDPAAVVAARQEMLDDTEDEYRRLLYVAMTRAADRLIVGGCMPGNRNGIRPLSWYDLIDQGSRQFRTATAGIRERRAARSNAIRGRKMPPSPRPPRQRPRPQRRSRCRHGCAPPRRRKRPPTICCALPIRPRMRAIVPDRRIDPPARAGLAARHAGAPAAAIAARHRSRAPARRRGTLSRPQCRGLDRRRARQRSPTGVLALIADPRFAAVFAPGSRAEVSIVGRLARPGRPPALVSGPNRPAGGDAETRS